MCRSVDEYLDRLKTSLHGSDPALIQDALADAEDHLHSALTEAGTAEGAAGEALKSIITEYGSPAETAASYRDIESRWTPLLTQERRGAEPSRSYSFFRIVADPRAWGAVLYMIFAISGIIYGLWGAAGAFLAIFTPFTLPYLFSLRGIALLEGRIVEALLGQRMPRRPLFVRDATWTQRIKALLADSRTWKTLAYMIIQLPLGLIYFVFILASFAVSLKAILYPILGPVFGRALLNPNSGPIFVPGWTIPLIFAGGCLLFILSLHAARAVGRIHGRYAKAMLVKPVD